IGRLRKPDRLVDFARLGRHGVAEFLKHVGDHHPDHDLVLDEEHRAARRPRRSHDVSPCPCPFDLKVWQIPAMNATSSLPGRSLLQRVAAGPTSALIAGAFNAKLRSWVPAVER